MALLRFSGERIYLMANVNRKKTSDTKKKRGAIFILFSILIIIYVAVSFITGNMGLFTIIDMQHTKKALIDEITRLEEDNKKLTEEIRRIKEDPEYTEAVARDRLGFVKKGETVYRFIE